MEDRMKSKTEEYDVTGFWVVQADEVIPDAVKDASTLYLLIGDDSRLWAMVYAYSEGAIRACAEYVEDNFGVMINIWSGAKLDRFEDMIPFDPDKILAEVGGYAK